MMKPISSRKTIGVLTGWQSFTGSLDSFLEKTYRGVLAACEERGFNVAFACGIGPGLGIGMGHPAWPIQTEGVDYIPIGPWNCDGLIVFPPIALDIGKVYFQGLIDSGYPLIFAGSATKGPGVIADNEGGIRQALFHLLQHGHRRIAYVAGRENDKDSDSMARFNAYKSFMNEFELELDPGLIAAGFHTYPGGKQAMQKIINNKIPFTAVLASNDQSAVGALEALREAGYLIPSDVAVIGFDDRTEAKIQIPLLTTVRFPMFELGFEAALKLIRRIGKQDSDDTILHIPTRLVVRQSCGCLGNASTQVKLYSPEQIVLSSKPRDPLNLIQSITSAALNENEVFSLTELNYLCQRLIDALILSLRNNDTGPFHNVLQQILQYSSEFSEDISNWQQVISSLMNNQTEIACLLEEELNYDLFIRLMDLARIEISDTSRWHQFNKRVMRDKIAEQIGQMSTQLFSAKQENQIGLVLQENLRYLNYRSAIIGLYEVDESDPYNHLQLSYYHADPGKPDIKNIHCLTRNFKLSDIISDADLFTIILLPIYIENTLAGFIAIETTEFDYCATITRLVGAAYRSARLYQDAEVAQKLAEDRRITAEEANKLKSRFLSMVSHELRTPLNLIAGLADLILSENKNELEPVHISRTDLERIHLSAQHLDALIRDVLDLGRLDAGQISLNFEALDPINLLDSVVAIGKQLAEDKNISWRYDIEPDLPKVWGDKTRLRQILLNLINNAIKFTSYGEVALTAIKNTNFIRITVQDTGLGIPKHEQILIFDEFHQSERTSARGFGGLGLGLAICKKLIGLHGGEIGVCSSGKEGEGSTFYITLPVLENIDEFQLFSPSENINNIQLLVTDLQAGHLVQDHLARSGYNTQILEVDGQVDWYSHIYRNLPDAILLDLNLTSEYGWEILRTIKGNPISQEIPVLFYSIKANEGSGSLFELDYLTKPLGANALSKVLSRYGMRTAPEDKSPSRILIVDDDPDMVELHSRMIEQQYSQTTVLKAFNGAQALEILNNHTVDVIFLDLMMPEVDGFTFLETIRSEDKWRSIPIIVITGQSLTEEDINRLNIGVTTVLSKGIYDLEETLVHIDKALSHKRLSLSENQKRVYQTVAYIHSNYAESFNRSDLARHVGMSERHLDRCFRSEMGISPIVYLNRYRIKQAKMLLEQGRTGITEIALAVGFKSSGYFARVFREVVGVSPRSYIQTMCNS
jgi:signal transduction histidine kinase/DNA-binding LacI/PurR family transcriptional regulator/CheY-like chemotaxis protein